MVAEPSNKAKKTSSDKNRVDKEDAMDVDSENEGRADLRTPFLKKAIAAARAKTKTNNGQ